MVETSQKSSGLKTASIAAVLGLALGGGLYAFLGGDGKPQMEKTAQNVSSQCQLSDDFRSKLDAAAQGDMAAFQVVDDSSSVAGLSFKDTDSADKTLGDWKGRTVLLNLWATWCGPCRREMPALDALEKQLGSEKFQVVPISLDLGTDEKPKGFYKQIGLQNLPFFHDGSLNTLTTLKKRGLAFGLPATLLVNDKGCVLGTLNGPAEWGGADAMSLIKAAM